MAESEWEHVKQIAADALEMPPDERPEFLRQACGHDAQRHAQVDALLRAHGEASGFLDAPTLSQPDRGPDDPRELLSTGAMIGPYKVLQLIGEGGFGSVYMAEQQAPVVRRVALKIIKLGMDTRQVIARFEAERQALALMDHPNIARVLDAGATPEGRPYFVMELVTGDPVTEYCDKSNLTIAQRLGLFVQVCHAVQHAHQKGVIHRDLKPTNIMVSTQDGRPFAKVIDFGIAKATAARLTEKTLFTEHKALIGTPEYMSPEQAEGSLDIDTRTDVYSLGVLLYELLTGSTPFDRKSLRAAAYAEIQRIIREVEPPKPSTRLSSLSSASRAQGVRGGGGTSLAQVAAHRSMEAGRLGSLVRGDLDWIVMKSLEKDRQRRYETAHDLAADVQRHLAGEAVVAAPPSRRYRLRKFARRNRAAVVAGSLITLSLMAGIAGTTWQAVRATGQKNRAEGAEADALEQAEIAQAVNDFLNEDLLGAVTPSAAAGRGIDVTMREVLEEASKRIDEASRPGGRFADKPLVEAAIRAMLAETLSKLRLDSRAEPYGDRAVELYRSQLGPEHQDTLRATEVLANIYRDQGKFDEANHLLETTLEIRRRVLGPEHPQTLSAMDGLASVLWARGKDEDARRAFEELLEICSRVLGPEHPYTMRTLAKIAGCFHDQGRYTDAGKLYAQVLEFERRVLGSEHPSTLTTLTNLALMNLDLGHHAEAQGLNEQALEISRRVMGPEHPSTLDLMSGLAKSLHLQGKYTEAQPLYEEVVEILTRVLGPEHINTLTSLGDLANVHTSQGNYGEAQRLLQQTLEMQRRLLGAEHPETLRSMGNLAAAFANQGNYAAAQPLIEEFMEAASGVLGPEYPEMLVQIAHLGLVLSREGNHAEARRLIEEALEAMHRVLGPENPLTLQSMGSLAEVLAKQGNYAEAQRLIEESLEAKRLVLGSEHPETSHSMRLLAAILKDQGEYAEAQRLIEEALEIQRRILGPDHPETLHSMRLLGDVLIDQGEYADAQRPIEEALEVQRRVLGPEHLDTLHSMGNLAFVLVHQGDLGGAQPLLQETLKAMRAVLGADHPDTLRSMQSLAAVLAQRRDYAGAELLLEEELEIGRDALGSEHPFILDLMSHLAFIYLDQRKHLDAERLFQLALAGWLQTSGRAHRETNRVRGNLIDLYLSQNRLDDARPLIEEQIRIGREIADMPNAPADALNHIAWMLLTVEPVDLRDPAAARGYAERAVQAADGRTSDRLDTLALAYHLTGDHERAIETEFEAIDLLPPGDSPVRSELEANLARFRAAAGQGGDSIPDADAPRADDSRR